MLRRIAVTASVLALAALLLTGFDARVLAASAAPAPKQTQKLSPKSMVEYRHRTDVALFNPRDLSLRWVDAMVGMDRVDLRRISHEVSREALLIWRDKDGLVCNCAAHLRGDEAPLSAEPVRDHASGLIVSIDETTYRTFAVMAGYPLSAVEPLAAAMANLAYVANERPLRAFFDARGFALDYAYGMANAGGVVNPHNLHLFVAHQRATGDVYIAVRGTGDLRDMVTNFSTAMVPWARGGHVHKGYETVARAAAELVRPKIVELARERPDRTVYATGHSLGAAVAGLLGLNLADLTPVHTLGLAAPPLGTAPFVEHEAVAIARIASYFVAHDEIRSLEKVARSRGLQWVGRPVDLGDLGATAGNYHLVINYMKGMLAIRGLPVEPFEQAIPICTLRVFPCFADAHGLLPLCVFDDPACLARAWPAMRTWLDDPQGGDPQRGMAAHRAAVRPLHRGLVARTITPDLHPFVLAELAMRHGASDPEVGLRFLDVAERRMGVRWLTREIRARLTAQGAL